MPRPNILYVHSHDTGRYVQPYGYAVPTPHIQALAESGVLFRQAYCAAPTCSPSRAALLTGQSPHSAGMLGLVNRGFALRDGREHIVSVLHAVGYRSALAGLQHEARHGSLLGYDQVLDIGQHDYGHSAEGITAAAVRWLEQAPEQPFWLSVGYFETHREFPKAGPADDERYTRPPAPLPDTSETRRDMAQFMASARILDTSVGTVLEALQSIGLADNTLVICTTDHGLAFPNMKSNVNGHGMGVMLILRGPGGFSGGRALDALVSQIDVFPTLCELLEIEPPSWLQGVSMLPLIRGERAEVRDELFGEVTFHGGYEPLRGVRTKRWQYTRRYERRPGPALFNCGDGLSKDVWLAHGWRDRVPEMEELYDLVFDPNEVHNLAADPAHSSVLLDMRMRLARWMAATNDPMLRGPVPLPEGCYASESDDVSPKELWTRRPRPQGMS